MSNNTLNNREKEQLKFIRLALEDATHYSEIAKRLGPDLIELLNRVEHDQTSAEEALFRIDQLLKGQDFIPGHAFDNIRQHMQWAQRGTEYPINTKRQAERMVLLAEHYIHQTKGTKQHTGVTNIVDHIKNDMLAFSDRYEMNVINTIYAASLIFAAYFAIVGIAIGVTTLSLATYGHFTSAIIYGLSETVALNGTISAGFMLTSLLTALPAIALHVREFILDQKHEGYKDAVHQALTTSTATHFTNGNVSSEGADKIAEDDNANEVISAAVAA